MNKTIFFDMDGTIADFYSVNGWLDDLINSNVRPYKNAKVMLNMSVLARLLNKLQANGYKIGIISWLSKSGTEEYNARVTETKLHWLNKHLHSVTFDEINIVEYGTPKSTFANVTDLLFDDEENNRNEWIGTAYTPNEIISVLKELASAL